ncbi:MAG: hotdog fold domain-containing protein [Actinomycetota bacterium]
MAADEDLADELRALARTLHETAADPSRRLAAHNLLREANELLGVGERRLRWYEVEPDADGTRGRTRNLSAFSGALNAIAPPMRLERSEWNGAPCMLGHVRISRLREGPPQSVHGGVMAGLFDEMMGATQGITGRPGGVTGRLTIRYRNLTPLDTDLLFRCWIERDRGMRIDLRAECFVADTVETDEPIRTAEAESIFVRRR